MEPEIFPVEYEDVIISIGTSAKGIEMMEFLMQNVKDASVSGDAGVSARTTEDDLRTKMQDPRYWNPVKRDIAFVKEVDEGFAQLIADCPVEGVQIVDATVEHANICNTDLGHLMQESV